MSFHPTDAKLLLFREFWKKKAVQLSQLLGDLHQNLIRKKSLHDATQYKIS